MEKMIREVSSHKKYNDITVIYLQGNIDSGSVNIMVQRFTKLLAEGKLFYILDMTDAEFVSSQGWSTLIGLNNNVRQAGGGMKLTGFNRDISKLFTLLEYNKVLDYYEDKSAAAESFHKDGIDPDIPKNRYLDIVEDFSYIGTLTLEEQLQKVFETYPGARLGEVRKLLRTPAFGGSDISLPRLAMAMVSYRRKRK